MDSETPTPRRDPVLGYTGSPPATPAPRSASLPLDGHGEGARVSLRFLVIAYLLFTAAALAALHLPGVGVTGQELGFRQTVFAAVNATTLTGFQQAFGFQQDAAHARTGADVLRLVLTLGGTLFSLTAGGMAVVRVARMKYTDAQVAAAACVATAVATLGGAAFLLDRDRGLTSALLQAASAFGNSGLYSGRLPGVLGWQTHAMLLPLAFAGGLGLPVLMELFDRLTGGRRLSAHSRTVLALAAGFYLLGVALLVLLHATRPAPAGGGGGGAAASGAADLRHTLALASTYAVNGRTAGFPFELAGALSRAAQWGLVALMVVGGNPGGTAGGVKTTAVYHLAAGVRDNLRGRPLSRGLGVAGVWVALYLAVVAAGFLLLLNTEPDTPDRLLFLAVSAASNVGLSHDPVSITGHGLFTLSALMLAGRLMPVFVLWWMASIADEDDAVAVG